MRLRPSDFQADPADPFENDLLDRKGHVETVCRTISDIDGHAVITIDAPWGAGKTAFVKMVSAHLRSTDTRVVEFNAWLESYTQNPMVDLVSAIARRLKSALSEQVIACLKRLAVALARAAVRAASDGVVDPDDLRKPESPLFTLWSETESKVTEFANQLSEAAASGDGPLVIVIDELDRCQPSYALDLLNTVRHLFDVDGVVIVLAINRIELCHSIEIIYGPGFDVDRYLRRFSDLSLRLSAPEPRNLSSFLSRLLAESGLISRLGAEFWSGQMLQLLTTATNCSLRDLEQAVKLAIVALSSPKIPPSPNHLEETISQQAAVALIVLRFAGGDVYEKLTNGLIDPFEAVAAINAAIPGRVDDSSGGSSYRRVHHRLEALLLMGRDPSTWQAVVAAEQEAFIDRYCEAKAGDAERGQCVFSSRQGILNYGFGDPIDLSDLASSIDLVDVD